MINGNNVTGTRLSSFANPDITWETTTTLNILLETAFLNDRLGLDVAYFDKTTTDMLLPSIKHYTSGVVALPDANTGEMNNSGVEVELSFRNYKPTSDWGYNIGVNLTFMQNKLVKLYGEGKYLDYGVARTYEGQPIGSFYGWKTDGIYQNQGQIDGDPNISQDPRRPNITPGDVIFVDTNGDNLVDEQDRVNIGDGSPTTLLGIYFDVSFKGLTLSGVFSGAYGHDLYDMMMMRGINPTESDGMDQVTIERWHGEGTSNKIPKMSTIQANQNYRYSELGLKSGNYTRLKDLSLSYAFPSALLNPMRLSNARIYIAGRNLLTFTGFDGVDPEETGLGTNLQRGLIYNNYPQSRTFIVGIDFTF